MKPRNDFERELQGYIDGGRLTDPTPKQMEQAIKIMDKDKTYRVWCFNTEQVINGMLLTKCYKVHRYGKGSAMTFFNLCLIRAERHDGSAWAARPTGIGCIDSFSYDGDLSIKLEHWWYKEYIKGLDTLKSYGDADKYSVAYHKDHNTYYFHDSRIETLTKSGNAHDKELLDELIADRKALSDHVWAAYKVAKRNGYGFQCDMWRWIAYVNKLRTNGKDYRNPVFVCPQDFGKAWNKIVDIDDKRRQTLFDKRMEKIRLEEERRRMEHEQWLIDHADEIAEQRRRMEIERIRRERNERRRDERAKKNYAKNHAKWLGIVIVGDNIVIRPLQSIEEFEEEGKAMHHCVYACGYYKKKDTLILSAKDNNGKRLATIEYDTKRGEIVQCRAACNQVPERYDEICELVRDNMKGNEKAVKAA